MVSPGRRPNCHYQYAFKVLEDEEPKESPRGETPLFSFDRRGIQWSLAVLIACMLLMLVALITLVLCATTPSQTPDFKQRKTLGHYNSTSIVPGCNVTSCRLPVCLCASFAHPGQFPLREVPMMVMLSFDDAVRPDNYPYYKRIRNENLVNPNKCPMRMTFFVSDVNGTNDYKLTKELFDAGHEIASHTQTHRFPELWWSHEVTVTNLTWEFEGQRQNLVRKSGILESEIKGVRVPFLEISGDKLAEMMTENNFQYDSSIVGAHKVLEGDTPLWPYTLDFPLPPQYTFQDQPPTGSYPGIWEVPMTAYACPATNSNTEPLYYYMLDECVLANSSDVVADYLRRHFLPHYRTRAPMGLFIHSSWFRRNSGSLEGLVQFLHEINSLPDVWLVSVTQLLEWMMSPTPISDIQSLAAWQC